MTRPGMSKRIYLTKNNFQFKTRQSELEGRLHAAPELQRGQVCNIRVVVIGDKNVLPSFISHRNHDSRSEILSLESDDEAHSHERTSKK